MVTYACEIFQYAQGLDTLLLIVGKGPAFPIASFEARICQLGKLDIKLSNA